MRRPASTGPLSPRTVVASRCASAVVVGLYLAFLGGTPLRLAAFLVLPLALTCFPNRIAASSARAPHPRRILQLGWILLALPIWIAPVLLVTGLLPR